MQATITRLWLGNESASISIPQLPEKELFKQFQQDKDNLMDTFFQGLYIATGESLVWKIILYGINNPKNYQNSHQSWIDLFMRHTCTETLVHYCFLWIVSTFCCLIASINLDLYLELRGLVLNLYPQQGQKNPSHFMNISHTWQRLCPTTYRPTPIGFSALWRTQMPLHVKLYRSLISSITGK